MPAAEIVNDLKPRADSLIIKLTGKPPEGFGISEAKARELIKANKEAVEKQLAAYPYRDLGKPRNNAAGWLIAAIEGDYTLPDTYLEEQEKKRRAVQSAGAKAATEGCQFCDEKGWRKVRTAEYPNGAMKRCSHNPEAEAKYSTFSL